MTFSADAGIDLDTSALASLGAQAFGLATADDPAAALAQTGISAGTGALATAVGPEYAPLVNTGASLLGQALTATPAQPAQPPAQAPAFAVPTAPGAAAGVTVEAIPGSGVLVRLDVEQSIPALIIAKAMYYQAHLQPLQDELMRLQAAQAQLREQIGRAQGQLATCNADGVAQRVQISKAELLAKVSAAASTAAASAGAYEAAAKLKAQAAENESKASALKASLLRRAAAAAGVGGMLSGYLVTPEGRIKIGRFFRGPQ